MLEPKKPADGLEGDTSGKATPAKDYDPTPAESLPDFEPGTLDPNNPDKE